MRAILIDTYNRTVTKVDTPGKIEDIYALVRTDIIEAVYFDTGRDCMYVDEEGLLRTPPKPLFQVLGFDQPLAGNGLILGVDGEGETCSTSLTLEAIAPLVVWRDHVEFVGFRPYTATATIFGQEVPVVGSVPLFEPKKDDKEKP